MLHFYRFFCWIKIGRDSEKVAGPKMNRALNELGLQHNRMEFPNDRVLYSKEQNMYVPVLGE